MPCKVIVARHFNIYDYLRLERLLLIELLTFSALVLPLPSEDLSRLGLELLLEESLLRLEDFFLSLPLSPLSLSLLLRLPLKPPPSLEPLLLSPHERRPPPPFPLKPPPPERRPPPPDLRPPPPPEPPLSLVTSTFTLRPS